MMMLQAVREAMFSYILHPEPSTDQLGVSEDDQRTAALAPADGQTDTSTEEHELPPSHEILFPEAWQEVDCIFTDWCEREMRGAVDIFLSFDRFTRQIIDGDG